MREKRDYTDEEWAYIAWEAKAERGIRKHLREAVTLAIQRHGREYGETYVAHILWEIWKEIPKPEPVRNPYVKAVIPRKLATRVFERDGYRCVHCGDWHDLCADHMVPESHGGQATLDNLQTLCRSCNSRKGARM
jgi:hypothetical protein